jgi:hypothetical protein
MKKNLEEIEFARLHEELSFLDATGAQIVPGLLIQTPL